jgi:tetratricopeptide (TPR) repeat protein
MPSDNPLERFHVPLMIYSPLIKSAHTFSSLALHSSITPTLLSLLQEDYGMSFPAEMPFISKPLLTDSTLSSNLDVAMIRNKNSIKEYIEGNYFLSDDKLYRIESDLSLTAIHQPVDRSRLQKKLVDFQNRSTFALNKNRLDKPAIPVQKNTFILTQIDLAVLNREHVASLNPDQQFERARQLAFAKDFTPSKSILKNLLNNSPNYHDVRIFLARTYAWQQQYDSATLFIRQVIARAPLYTDAYVSLSDVEFWQSKLQQSLEAAEQGLQASPSNEDLLVRKARALEALGKKSEAKNLVSQLIKKDSHDELALVLWQKLNNK